MVRSVTEMLDSAEPRSTGRPGAQALILLAGSAALAGGAAVLLIARHRLWAGASAAGSAAGLLLANVPGGPRARRSAGFAYLVLDLAFDTCILAPIAWVARLGSPRVSVLALVGLGASYVASYERARGASLGFSGSEGFLYRALRAALLVFGLLTGWIEQTLWAFAAVALAAAAVRAWSVAGQHRSSVRGPA